MMALFISQNNPLSLNPIRAMERAMGREKVARQTAAISGEICTIIRQINGIADRISPAASRGEAVAVGNIAPEPGAARKAAQRLREMAARLQPVVLELTA